ncbi:ABC transporter permease, partial [Paracoccaceae bacterium]|nr:ABC transporter permease [Paracoccaceae bacterium]
MSHSSKYLKIFAFTYLIFLYAPALLLPIFSFNSSQIIAFPLTGFSTHWFKTLFYQETLHEALKNSLIIAVASSCLGTILGVFAARATTRYDFSGKQITLTFILAPLVLPEIIVGVALLIVLMQMGLSLNLWSVVLGHTLLITPFSILIMNSAFNNLDISLEEASLDLGETQFGTFQRVILPLVFPGIIASLLIGFTLSLDEFIIAF